MGIAGYLNRRVFEFRRCFLFVAKCAQGRMILSASLVPYARRFLFSSFIGVSDTTNHMSSYLTVGKFKNIENVTCVYSKKD